MSTFALVDATTWVHSYDMTGDSNKLSFALETEELDATTFASGGYRTKIGGLKTVSAGLEGFWQSAALDAVDPQVFTNLGTADHVVTMAHDDAEGSVAYLAQMGRFKYSMFDQMGQITPFTLAMMGTNGVGAARGMVLKAKGNISGTGVTGTVQQVGAVASGKYLYAAVHCFSIGTSFTLQIQSDNASNFPSATTQMTVGSITAVGGTWGTRVAGPITDDFWRVNVSAVSGTSQIAVAVGIA